MEWPMSKPRQPPEALKTLGGNSWPGLLLWSGCSLTSQQPLVLVAAQAHSRVSCCFPSPLKFNVYQAALSTSL